MFSSCMFCDLILIQSQMHIFLLESRLRYNKEYNIISNDVIFKQLTAFLVQ